MTASLRLWVTRTPPQAQETAERLRAMGHQPVVAPLLDWRMIEGAVLNLAAADGLAFTSRNAVDAFCRLTQRRDLPVLAVGDSTAEAARAAGFDAVESAGGDLGDLAALIARRGLSRIVHPGPREAAGDLPGATPVAIYETYETGQAAPPGLDGVLIHSPKAGRALAKALERGGAEGLCAYAISKAAAAPLASLKFQLVAVAQYPNEQALLKLIGDTNQSKA